MTAAHCFDEEPDLKNVKVVVGATKAYQQLDKALPVKKVVRHPDYDPITLAYDLAIVRLTKAVPYAKTFKVERPDDPDACGMTHVLGYGVRPDPLIWNTKPYYDSGVLHGEPVLDLSNKDCSQELAACVEKDRFIPFKSKGAPFCHGDSGGAVFMYCGQQGNFLVGVSSARLGKRHNTQDLIEAPEMGLPKDPPVTRQVPTSDKGWFDAVTLGAPMAFSQGNACGATADTPGYIAAKIDYTWVNCVLAKKPCVLAK